MCMGQSEVTAVGPTSIWLTTIEGIWAPYVWEDKTNDCAEHQIPATLAIDRHDGLFVK